LSITGLGSRIEKRNKREGWEKFVVLPFFIATNVRKKKKIIRQIKNFGPIYKEFYNFLPKKLSLSSQKYEFRIRDLRSGSGIRKKPIPDPGYRG
jgi:hypothetical protein